MSYFIQIAITKCLRLSNLKITKSLLTVLETGKSKTKVPADVRSDEGLFSVDVPSCVLTHQKGQIGSLKPFIRVLIPSSQSPHLLIL